MAMCNVLDMGARHMMSPSYFYFIVARFFAGLFCRAQMSLVRE